MDSAAANGHLETVQWLPAHRVEGGTEAGVVEIRDRTSVADDDESDASGDDPNHRRWSVL
ncbi:hypothetical protein SPRG_14585 [Saprolegnia parasitica CBS 223.65]|uniref:Uncharacterized protein n=1 Tax=Saprolegnia parasitica (strain CBS 223.65) TaxID=695850 RepID=A0A067BT46_SAPPC|nr:hypothetical protein SPRG_14585 [Saprolegnia parasitica CBS 223.65]KDO20005.1 hypothetical protein SPRG_14585 [Saprolegnia parasitica CBS 223.65]|eukprot:XP_012209308.1 hypothetical protein SPRG_14585 [Saprolegnia parasitica CBS 223.65]